MMTTTKQTSPLPSPGPMDTRDHGFHSTPGLPENGNFSAGGNAFAAGMESRGSGAAAIGTGSPVARFPAGSTDLSDPLWRLRNLYQCRAEGRGGAMPFVPRPEQEMIFQHLLERPEVPAYIIKSRRLGLSTGICTFQADHAVFHSGWRGVLIDQKQEDATKKMVEILRFAIDNLPPVFLNAIRFDKRNDSELRLRVLGEKEVADSVIYAATGARGGDCSMLHVSEWGPIAATDPARSEAIRTGAFPAARQGRRVVETTWMGGKGGDLWDLIRPILECDPNAEGRIFFFPWHDDPVSVKTGGAVTEEVEDYFRDLTGRLGKRFAEPQKMWWAAKRLEQGIFMSREYPANTRTIYFQMVGREIHLIDHDTALDYGPTERVAHMRAKGYPLGMHFLPHDAAARERSGLNFEEQLKAAGLTNIRIVPRCVEVWTGINKTMELLPRMVFHARRCEKLLQSIEAYHTRRSSSEGHLTDTPVHDWSSHDADALRQIGEAMDAGLLKDGPEPPPVRVISPIQF